MSRAGWKAPDEPWEQHSRPQARAALNAARKSGRWLKKSSGRAKVWGVITCRDPDLPASERCSTSVLSTSGSPDGSETAQHINKVVRSCTHQRTTRGEVDPLADAEAQVLSAGQCLAAAKSLVEARGHRDLVEDLLNESEAATLKADALLEKALAEDQLADVAEATARAAAAAAGTSTDLGPRGLAVRARDQASEARESIADGTDRRARLLKDQCEDIRSQARTLLAQLD